MPAKAEDFAEMRENPGFREIKRSISGQERAFDCGLIAATARVAIVKWVFPGPMTIDGRRHEPGGWTEGFFWRGRNYNLYHIVNREGEPLADRFDVIDHVRLGPTAVRYDDLLLDLWLYPDGRVQIEDEEEVQEALAAGLLSEPRLAIIRRTEQLLLRRGRHIVDAALRDLAALR
jgi:hypothetical protein